LILATSLGKKTAQRELTITYRVEEGAKPEFLESLQIPEESAEEDLSITDEPEKEPSNETGSAETEKSSEGKDDKNKTKTNQTTESGFELPKGFDG